MSREIYAELTGEGIEQPVFEGVQVQAELHESLSITTITQSYCNAGEKNIEAVYTFPLPLDAVLLEMTITLGDTTLQGTVLPKQMAEEQYEEAITDGDAPVMLQNEQPGIYTMNVGNLLPGEKIVITIRYGMFLRWQGDTLRYHLPTTIAPRYGSAEQAGLALHQEPETTLLVENLFSFGMSVKGLLAGMAITSPSHEITVKRTQDSSESLVGLTRQTGFMDRDLIITINNTTLLSATASVAKDGEYFLLWASFQPRFDCTGEMPPRSVKIVVDCSGSMSGDSINQAREALLRVLDELRPQDWFNIVAFGNKAIPLFNAQVQATSESLAFARGFLMKLDANMGGTEIGNALKMAIRLRCQEPLPQDILLITDGEIWEWEKVVADVKKTKHRFFTVGVGSSVSEAFVRTLAERTGGACELVSPHENMAERIHQHFKRIGTLSSTSNRIIWPVKPLKTFPASMSIIFDGDTCNLFAWFAEPPVGDVTLQLSQPGTTDQTLTASIHQDTNSNLQDNTIARMVAALRLREMTDDEAYQQLAVDYQLISNWTNYLAIVKRDEDNKADTLPKLRKVQQMLAAGWGGTGTTLYSAPMVSVAASVSKSCYSACGSDIPTFIRGYQPRSPQPVRSSKVDMSAVREQGYDNYESYTPPTTAWLWDNENQYTLIQLVELIDMFLVSGEPPAKIALPLLPDSVSELLHTLVNEGFDEQVVVIIFLHCLNKSSAGDGFSRQVRRVIEKAYKQLQVDQQTLLSLEERFKSDAG